MITLAIFWRVMLQAPYTLMREYGLPTTAIKSPTDAAIPSAPVETQRPLGEGQGEDQFQFVFTQARSRDAQRDGSE